MNASLIKQKEKVMNVLKSGHSKREVQHLTGASHGLVQKVTTLMGD